MPQFVVGLRGAHVPAVFLSDRRIDEEYDSLTADEYAELVTDNPPHVVVAVDYFVVGAVAATTYTPGAAAAGSYGPGGTP